MFKMWVLHSRSPLRYYKCNLKIAIWRNLGAHHTLKVKIKAVKMLDSSIALQKYSYVLNFVTSSQITTTKYLGAFTWTQSSK